MASSELGVGVVGYPFGGFVHNMDVWEDVEMGEERKEERNGTGTGVGEGDVEMRCSPAPGCGADVGATTTVKTTTATTTVASTVNANTNSACRGGNGAKSTPKSKAIGAGPTRLNSSSSSHPGNSSRDQEHHLQSKHHHHRHEQVQHQQQQQICHAKDKDTSKLERSDKSAVSGSAAICCARCWEEHRRLALWRLDVLREAIPRLFMLSS